MHWSFYFVSLISQESVSTNFFTLNSRHGFAVQIDEVMVLSTQVLIHVQKVDSAIHRINDYPLDSAIDFPSTYPLDSDLSGG